MIIIRNDIFIYIFVLENTLKYELVNWNIVDNNCWSEIVLKNDLKPDNLLKKYLSYFQAITSAKVL